MAEKKKKTSKKDDKDKTWVTSISYNSFSKEDIKKAKEKEKFFKDAIIRREKQMDEMIKLLKEMSKKLSQLN